MKLVLVALLAVAVTGATSCGSTSSGENQQHHAVAVAQAAREVPAQHVRIETGDARVGKKAPPFSVHGLDGGRISLEQFRGRPLFVNFFASWCPPCKLEEPFIVKDYPKYKDRVAFLSLDQQETPEAIKPFLKHFKISWTVGVDPGNVGARYHVNAIPVSVFIDKDGIVRALWLGYMPPRIFHQNMKLIAPN